MILKIIKLYNKILSWFSKPEPQHPEINTYTPPTRTREAIIDSIDYTNIKEPDIYKVNDTNKTLLFMDDIAESEILYKVDISRMLKTYKKSVLNDFTLVHCFDNTAGYMVYKYILAGNNIDYAILDVSLGYKLQVSQTESVTLDGIDVALLLLKHNPDVKFLFSTVHTMNERNPEMSVYYKKFRAATGKSLMDHYLDKNSYRHDKLYTFLYGDENETNS